MKKFLVSVLFLIYILTLPSVCSAGNSLSEPDKQKHMVVSAVGSSLLVEAGMTPTKAFLTMVGIGLVKELTDSHNAMEEHKQDMLANTIGASVVFTYSVEF